MKRFILMSIGLSMLASAPAYANGQNPKRVGCYVQVNVPAKYRVKQVKIKDSYRQYIKRFNGQIDLVEYPAIYREEKRMIEEAHIVMREVTCKNAPMKKVPGRGPQNR